MAGKRFRRRNWWPTITLLTIVLVASGYVCGQAYFQSRSESFLTFGDLIVPRVIDVIIAAWCLWIGSSIGSFLNVVAWRMPRGQGVGGRSYCPRCQSQLLARDNFPVLGWIFLGGRCRVCRLPISCRYPIVEAAVGLSLGTIGLAELYQLALPYQVLHSHGGPLWSPQIRPDILVVLIYHVSAVAVGWAYGLARFDGNRIPGGLAKVGLLLTMLPLCLLPQLMVVSWQLTSPLNSFVQGIPTFSGEGDYIGGLVRVLTALAAAGFCGRSLARSFCPAADPKMNPLGDATRRLLDLVLIISVPAIVIGWQSLPAVLLVASLLAMVLRPLTQRPDNLARFAVAIPIATTIQIILWRYSIKASWWPSDGSDPIVILVAAAAAMCIPIWLPADRSKPESLPPDVDTGETDDENEPDDGDDA